MRRFIQRGLIVLWLATAVSLQAANTLVWKTNRVDADIQSMELPRLLAQVAAFSGWRVYLEPGTSRDVSAKFKNLPPGEALHRLLGDLNFALVPQTNASPRLYVFRTSQNSATELIKPTIESSNRAKPIANQVLVTLKPGVKIEDIARLLGAKIVGRMDVLNTYLLEFADDASANAARDALLGNSDVATVDTNFSLDLPPPNDLALGDASPEFDLKPQTNSGPCHIIVGVIDTPVQPLGNGLNAFVLPAISAVSSFAAQTGSGPATSENSSAGEMTHGSAMAETILRSIQATSGGKTSVQILPVDVYGNNPATTTFNVAEGIYRAVNAGANVINLSLGSEADSPFLHKLIQDASRQGVVFFAAAGNAPVTTPVFPAAYPEVVAVTAGNQNGQIADYANRGSFVDVIAPGTSFVPFQGQAYMVTGTSAAAAFASGTAAGIADSTHNCPDQVVQSIRGTLGVNTTRQ